MEKLRTRISHIPLTLFYSSLTKLSLLLLLSIWRRKTHTTLPPIELPQFLAEYPSIRTVLEFLDEERFDREWAVRNVLGGMSAGFGLRGTHYANVYATNQLILWVFIVALDCHPVFTTVIVLFGWAAKTLVASHVAAWVSINDDPNQWMAYSIP